MFLRKILALNRISNIYFHDFSADNVLIALMGVTGAGKSAFISLYSD